MVITNDPVNKSLNLKIEGPVKKFVTITPKRVRISGEVGEEIKTTVSIIPEKDHPFKILEVKPLKKDNIKVSFEEIKKKDRTEYLITVTNLKDMKVRYFDSIMVKTDSKDRPELKISVYGNIYEKKKPKPVKQPKKQ